MKKWGLLDIVIGLLSLMMVLVIVVIVFFVSFPTAGKNIMESLRAELGISAGYEMQDLVVHIGEGIQGRAQDGFNYRIKPFFVNGYELAASPFKPSEEELVKKETIEDVRKCLDCHRDKIARRTALSHIYIDHKEHLEKGVYCNACHPGVDEPTLSDKVVVSTLEEEFESERGDRTHSSFIKDTSVFRPASDKGVIDTSGQIKEVVSKQLTHKEKPATISEGLCVKCHKKDEKAPVNCGGCHPPGSVFADEVYSKSKADNFLSAGHVQIPLPAGFEHGKSTVCTQCHPGKKYCQKCHEPKYKHPSNWVSIHGTELGVKKSKDPNYFKGRSRASMSICNMCHWQTWCAQTCHKNPGTVRKNAGLIVPLRSLELYLNF